MDISKLSGMMQQAQQRFKTADADGDGALSRAEFDQARANGGKVSADAFAKLDGDGDGMLTQDEMRAGAQAQMKGAMKAAMQAGGKPGIAAGGAQPDLLSALTETTSDEETDPAQQRLDEIEAVLKGEAPKSSLQFGNLLDKTA